MSSTLIFIFVLSVLIVVHELGHLLAARAVGVRAEKFSIGFGPVIFGKKFGETEFCVSLFPLGGFVKLAGESPEESKGAAWEFNAKGLAEKFFIVFAGPFMNALLAFVLFAAVFIAGQPALTTKIGKVMEGAPAEAAGILAGDKILAVNGQAVTYWEDILKVIYKSEKEVMLSLDRGGRKLDIPVYPKTRDSQGLFGKKSKVAFVGVMPSNEVTYVRHGFFEALWLAAERVWSLTVLIFYSLGLMITGALSFKESVTGPIGIFFMTQQAAQMGVSYLFYFMGSLSVSLFVLNLLPIPALDGGHVLFILIEKLKGSPLKESVKEKMTQGGLVLLLILMGFVIFQDVQRFAILENIRKFFVRS